MSKYEDPVHTASDVLERACALAGMVTVYTMERDFPRVPPGERPSFAESYSYLTRVYRSKPPTGLLLSPTERAILEKPLGTWSTADTLNIGWRTEGAAMLAWAIGLIDRVFPYDHMASYEQIQQLVELETRKRSVTLRPSEDLDRALTEAEKWHWRARQTQGYFANPSVDALTGPAADRRKQTIGRALREPARLFGKAYEDLTFREWSIARSIASERHYALNWLWNGEPWEEVTTDT